MGFCHINIVFRAFFADMKLREETRIKALIKGCRDCNETQIAFAAYRLGRRDEARERDGAFDRYINYIGNKERKDENRIAN